MIRAFGVPLALVAVTLAGCASSLSGVGGTENYGCKAPEGVMCDSVSGVYANSIRGNLRSAPFATPKSPSAAPTVYGATSVALGPSGTPGAAGNAIRSNPRLLRVWIAPWEDSDGDLHEEGYLHVVVDTGRWLIEHVRPAPRSGIDGVAPPLPVAPSASPSKVPSDSQTPPERLPAPSGPGSSTLDAAPPER